MLDTGEAEKLADGLGILKFKFADSGSIYYKSLYPMVSGEKVYYYQLEFQYNKDEAFFAYDNTLEFLGDLNLLSIAVLDNDKIEDVIYQKY